jgi:beta-glucanase (GH16 family)
MEWIGKKPHEALGTLHGPGYSGGHGCSGRLAADKPLSDDWHEFSITWKPEEITWFLDDRQYFQAKPQSVAPKQWVFDRPFYLLLNLAVGGKHPGPPAEDLAASTHKLQVQYIRIYEFDGFGEVKRF